MNKNKLTPFIIGALAIAITLIVVFAQYNAKKNKTPVYPPTTSTVKDTTASIKKASEYTLAQVAAHNKRSNCWTAINGGVYNVTTWIDQHPGGEDKILGLCGIDGSSAFNGQHSGQVRPASELASFKIGTLK